MEGNEAVVIPNAGKRTTPSIAFLLKVEIKVEILLRDKR
jgi:hypothetical protein